MANSRISDLQQKTVLHSTGVSDSADDEALFLIAREKSHNETINYRDLKNSVTDYCVTITGDQSIAGEKTFENNSFFQSDVDISGNLKVEGNLSVQGDIFNLKFDDGMGGDADQYLTQLDSNLVTKGNQEVDGDSTLKGNLSVSGQASVSGNTLLNTLETTGATDIYGELGVSGDASLTNLSVSDSTILEGSLNTKGQTVLDQDLSVQGKIISPTVQGNTLLEGDLNTKGETVLEQNLEVQSKVGIGTNNPEFGLHVKGDGDILVEDAAGGSAHFRMRSKDPSDQSILSYWKIKSSPEGLFEIDNDSPQRTSPTNSALCIDGTTSDVGIGTLSPVKKLDVAGDINFSGDLYKGGSILPIGEWERAGINDIYFDRGNVGIGLTAPTQPLDVAGTIKSQGLEIDGDAEITGKLLFSNHYSQETDLPSPSAYHGMFAHVHNTGRAYFSHAGEWLPLLNMTADGKVGIGTIFPDEALHVEGNIKLIGDILGLESFTASGTLTALDINAQNDVNIQNDLNILADGILTLHGSNSKIVAPKIQTGDIEADQIDVTGENLTVSGIDSKLGVGIASDLEARLHVVGESKFDGLVKLESATPVLDITDVDQPTTSASLSGLINFNSSFSGTKENFGSIGYADTDNKLKITNTLDGVEFLAAGDTSVKGGDLTVEDSGGTLKLNIAPNAISHTKDNGALTISAQGTDNDLILRASGDIKFVDQGNNAKLTIDGATGNTSLTGDLSFSGKIYNDGVEFSGGPIKSGDTFNGAVVVSPATASATGVKGDFLFDDEYAYICVADSDGNDANKKAWKRFPISDW
ncbi:MAG: hypothetical protein ACR2ON_00015 [Paracoccaceae bacterium]